MDAIALQELLAFGARHTGHLLLKFGIDKNRFVWYNEVSELFLQARVSEAFFVHIEHIDDGLVGEKGDIVVGGVFFAFGGEAGAGLLVGELQFEVDDVDVVLGLPHDVGLGGAVGTNDIGVGKGADDVADGLALADVGEELIAETLTLARASDEAGDVDKFDSGRDGLGGVIELGEVVEAGVRDGDDTDIGLDGGKGIVSCESAGAGEGVKEGGFADIREADDSDFEIHKIDYIIY